MDGSERSLLGSEVPLVAVLSAVRYHPVVTSNVTEVREVQFRKAYPPMLVTLFGMVTEVKRVQFWKAEKPMLATPSPIVTEVKPVQLWKAPLPNPVRTPYQIAA